MFYILGLPLICLSISSAVTWYVTRAFYLKSSFELSQRLGELQSGVKVLTELLQRGLREHEVISRTPDSMWHLTPSDQQPEKATVVTKEEFLKALVQLARKAEATSQPKRDKLSIHIPRNRSK
jgi:hypothetical protein